MALPGDTGTDADPTGLSTIRAYTPSRRDPYALQAYGGDLKGNVWRFDLSDPDETNWKVEAVAEADGRATATRSRSPPACASRSIRTTTSTATCSSAPASCSVRATSAYGRSPQHAVRDPGRHPHRGGGRTSPPVLARRILMPSPAAPLPGSPVRRWARPRLVPGRGRADGEDRHRRLCRTCRPSSIAFSKPTDRPVRGRADVAAVRPRPHIPATRCSFPPAARSCRASTSAAELPVSL